LLKNQNFIARLRFALHGIQSAFKRERSFRSQLLAATLAIAALAVLRAPPVWWAIFLLLITTILAFELMNTALEIMIDHLHKSFHEQIGLAKDCAAGAVLILSFISVVLFLIFLYEKFAVSFT
jgi:diacylglycerol kinase (ATP)